jgi:L-malate glycosyltransferase
LSKKKHILFISSWYPTQKNPTHGIFNFYFAQAVALNNKVSVLHVSSDDNLKTTIQFDQQNESGIDTLRVYYKKVNSNTPLISQLLKFKRLKKAFDVGYTQLIKSVGKPDLIHLNVAMPAGIGVLYLADKYQLPYLVNENWSGYCKEDGNYKGFFLKHFTKKIISGAQAILPTSEFLKEAMLSHGLNGNYFVVPNVVDVHRFIPKQPASTNIQKFVHISSLTNREKNVKGIVRAFAQALLVNSNMQLNIVGEGVERKELEDFAKKLNTQGKINFVGRLIGEELVHEINAADSLVMFSYFETFCLVIVEAFACGKPVITSNAGAIISYMKPDLGNMVEKGNEAELTKAFIDFSEHKHNYHSENIRKYAVENFSYEKVSLKLDVVYNTILAKPKLK